ncbi:MAG: LysR family transcriptional regulator [Methylibium sp.]|uniref:LysR family transcriptional regulator n=1 Tax=Methylibium sp. TaxID=2067992 RepID=UPI00185CA289|nr:LysR family transcriptional regulator [Methylibium sp.]MBA3595853.1 LysR family transcriptional regulator [Methylibium sp.]
MTTTPTPPLWAHVHALGLVAQLGSFTQAAQRLGLSKAAVSQRIAELERSVGVPLLQRTTRSVRLTEAGRQLVDETSAGFTQIEQGLAAVRDLALQPRGLLRVSAPVALGRQQVAPQLEPFLRAWPGIRVDLALEDRVVNLAHEGFDLGVRHTSTPPDSHVAWKLCASRTLLVATPAYLRRRGVPEHPGDLAAHDCVAYLRPGPAVWPFERLPVRGSRAAAEPERVRVTVSGALRVNNSEVLRDAVLAGLGIGLLPDFSAAAALKAGRLRELLPLWRPIGFFGDAVYALRPWSPQVPRAVRALVEHLRAALAAGFG